MHSSVLLFLSNLFSTDMILIIFVALLLFGGEKLPEIARGLGKGIRDFKDASEGVKREINEQINSYERKVDDKKAEEAIVASQQATQSQLPEQTETSTGTIIRPAENTIPVSESQFSADVNSQTENSEAVKTEPVTETHEHADVQHKSNGISAS
ncbi:MAG: sec-independent protein translocase protein TatA [Mucilaginibacter sp.]|nr:sec-independent protein translocase protein TatA [Mucilaginibacter sp.]